VGWRRRALAYLQWLYRIHRTLDDGVEVPSGTQFVAFLHETRKGYIRFNNGAPPSVYMVRIDEDADIPDRKTLGDNDKAAWPIGQSGDREDPWKMQFCIPMARYDAGGERFIYIARGIVARSVEDLLGSWRYHPKRAAGLVPVLSVENGTYPSKRFGGRKPKSVLRTVFWVTKTGSPAPETPKEIEKPKPDFNDSVGF
jgi:hypothetical protein